MKMFLIAAALAALVASPALGADLRAPAPVNKAPPPPAPVYRWSGCYVGLTAGYSDHHATFNEDGRYSWDGWSNGFIGGGELGCNFQSDSFVYGIEGDFSGLTNKKQFDGGYYGLYNWKINWLATVRLRSGLTVGKTLLYLTYGAAFGHDSANWCSYGSSSSYSNYCVPNYQGNGIYYSSSGSATKIGWVVGAGFARALTDNLSVKFEALYADLGNHDLCDGGSSYANCTGGTSDTFHNTIHNSVYIARAGLDWKFYSLPEF